MEMAPDLTAQEPIDQIKKGDSVTSLLGRGDSLEVMEQVVPAGVTFYLDSPDQWDGMEFLYLLEGKISRTDTEDQQVWEAGSYFGREPDQGEIWFQAETETHLLYISSQPSFHLMREEVEEFREMAQTSESAEGGLREGHPDRLDKLARRVGDQFGIEGKRKSDLSYGAYFHDLGKSEIPDRILTKEADLTEEEWSLIETHPIRGREIMEEKSFLQEAAKIVEQTHERYDGDGYPHGLAGEEIALEARIISVVDAWDVMLSERPYEEAMTEQKAREELKENAGTQFDPQVVEVFLTVVAKN